MKFPPRHNHGHVADGTTPDQRATRAAWGEAIAGLGSILQTCGSAMVRSAYESAEAELAGPDDPDGGLEIRDLGEHAEPPVNMSDRARAVHRDFLDDEVAASG